MLHWLKVACLVLLTLAAMRLVSLVPLILARRLFGWNGWKPAVFSNAAGLAAFAVLLRTQALPGELVDPGAATFGVLVYAVFALADVCSARRRSSGATPPFDAA